MYNSLLGVYANFFNFELGLPPLLSLKLGITFVCLRHDSRLHPPAILVLKNTLFESPAVDLECCPVVDIFSSF